MRTRRTFKPAPLSTAKALGFLLKSHYLADEFPSVVTTTNFADYCVTHYATLPSIDELLKRTTLCSYFSMPRTVDTRRVLALPHPTSQLALSRIIASHRAEIRKTIESSQISLYDTKPKLKDSRAFIGIDFDSKPAKEFAILSRHPVILKADIVNFFHTIYTHSIPWGVLGKQHVKDIREGKDKTARVDLEKHWASLLDVAIQRGNSRETFGIPVGPDTSRIIAELLLAGVHKYEPFAKSIEGRGAYRIVDDFFIGFEDEAAARRCRDQLRRALWDFNLHLNEEKTEIIRSAFVVDNGWEFDLDNFQLSHKSDTEQRSAVERLLEIALGHCEASSDWRPIVFFCRRLLALKIYPGNLPFIRDCMLRLGRDFPTCLKLFAQFMIHYRANLRDRESRVTIEEWARQILSTHSRRDHDYEVASVLVIVGSLVSLWISRSWRWIKRSFLQSFLQCLVYLVLMDYWLRAGMLGAKQRQDRVRCLTVDTGCLTTRRFCVDGQNSRR
jgi:hypothetical protein